MNDQYDSIALESLNFLERLKRIHPHYLAADCVQLQQELQQLRAFGYTIHSSEEFGLVLSELPDMVYSWDVAANLGTQYFGCEVRSFPFLDSTNRYAAQWAAEGARHGAVVVTDQQLKGRGRFERQWVSPAGKGLYFTIIFRPALKMREVPLLTLLVSVAVVEAIENICDIKALIKWPNDVLYEGHKLCGILAEARSDKTGKPNYAVVGIGVNANLEPEDFPSDAKGTSLKMIRQEKISRTHLLRCILKSVEKHYANFATYGFSYLKEQWYQKNGTIGREVTVNTNDGATVSGVALGLSDQGGLLVQLSDGTEVEFLAGDVSIGSTNFQ